MLFVSQTTLAKYDSWIDKLTVSKNQAEVQHILKCLRNKLLGHNQLKKYMVANLGLIEKLALFLNPSTPRDIQVEAVIILGSLANGSECNLNELIKFNIPTGLLTLLQQFYLKEDGERLIDAVLRSLRSIYRHTTFAKDLIYQEPNLKPLIAFLDPSLNHSKSLYLSRISQFTLVILANCCDSFEKQNILHRSGMLINVIRVLQNSKSIGFNHMLAALIFLAAITRENVEICNEIQTQESFINLLFKLLLKKNNCEILLLSSLILTNLIRTSPKNQPGNLTCEDPRINRTLLPLLITMLDKEQSIRIRAIEILTVLISDSESLQYHACQFGVVDKLKKILESSFNSDQEIEITLLAFSALASFKEECRKKVIESNIFSSIVAAMQSQSEKIRCAACQCTRSLSRSVKNLRTALVDAGITSPLMKLLFDPSLLVIKTACAALCNIVLDFSPMKEMVLRDGLANRLVELVSIDDNELRANALWALKNLIYMAETSIKIAVVNMIGHSRLEALSDDPCPLVQEQTLNLIRNLICEKEQDINEVLKYFGPLNLIKLIEKKILSDNLEIVMHSCYIIANMCTALTNSSKDEIMQNETILKRISSFLSEDKSPQLQLAALWCVINLTWTDDAGSAVRIGKLRELGLERRLVRLNKSHTLMPDVRDRLNTALDNFSALDPPNLSFISG